jgi:hypothetical protein
VALTDGPHSFEVRATDPTGVFDPTPAMDTFTVDTTAPDVTITGHPKKRTTKRKPSFAFGSSEPGVAFSCQIDDGPWTDCSSPFTSAKLSRGRHTFRVKAVDAAGNETAPPADFTFRIVRRR